MNKIIQYTFDDYLSDISRIYDQIKQYGKQYSAVVGIPRGGLVAAVHLSHKLKIPLLDWREIISLSEKYNKTFPEYLFVDEIIDSGVTIDSVLHKEEDVACLLWNEHNDFSVIPTFHGTKFSRKETDAWFEFWWEK